MAKKKNTHEIVKYHNSLNKVPFGELNQRELNIFFAICSKLKVPESEKEKLIQETTLTFKELRSLTGCESITSNKIFAKVIAASNDKLIKATPAFETSDGKIVQFALFNKFVTDPNNATLTVSVSPDFIYILSAAVQFTRFELDEYVSIKSTYAKIAYQSLKQWRHAGCVSFTTEEFRDVFCIPESFKASHINDRVLKPILEQLDPYFKNLCVEKVHGSGSGRKIIKYIFHFEPEERFKNKNYLNENEVTTGLICPICGEPLVEKELNGSMAWCHADGWKENAKCKVIYNTVAEIHGYKEK